MKKLLATLFGLFMYCSLHSQDLNNMAGDWIRVRAEYSDGETIPNGHGARIIMRYHFTKKEVYQVYAESTLTSIYSRKGNVLKIEPIQLFAIEQYTNEALTLLESAGAHPIRYYMIPTDSFQRMGIIKYSSEVVNSDTIYTNQPGIEPIYKKGQNEFMSSIMAAFTENESFNFTYVVRKDGTIGDVTVKASTNPRLDKRLIKLVKKTSGEWIPSTYQGKAVHVLMSAAISVGRTGAFQMIKVVQ
jgi:hypothetical protein